MFIHHFHEEDEKKDHTHLWVKPNKLIDTMALQEQFIEFDPSNPLKPLKTIDWNISQVDDWILYGQHYEPYLASKNQVREFHYTKDDFYYHDEDTFENLYIHAFKGSDWALRIQTLTILNDGQIHPADLIANGSIPLNLATNVRAFQEMRSGKVYRNGHKGHD